MAPVWIIMVSLYATGENSFNVDNSMFKIFQVSDENSVDIVLTFISMTSPIIPCTYLHFRQKKKIELQLEVLLFRAFWPRCLADQIFLWNFPIRTIDLNLITFFKARYARDAYNNLAVGSHGLLGDSLVTVSLTKHDDSTLGIFAQLKQLLVQKIRDNCHHERYNQNSNSLT